MNLVLAILLGLALIGIVVGGVISAVEAAAKGSIVAKNSLILWLGRRQLGVKAHIPEQLVRVPKERRPPKRRYRDGAWLELPVYPSPLPPEDLDHAEFVDYKPKAAVPRPLRSVMFKGAIEHVFNSSIAEPTGTIDIDRVADLLGIESILPYAPLFATLGDQPSYPVAPPEEPPRSRLHLPGLDGGRRSPSRRLSHRITDRPYRSSTGSSMQRIRTR